MFMCVLEWTGISAPDIVTDLPYGYAQSVTVFSFRPIRLATGVRFSSSSRQCVPRRP